MLENGRVTFQPTSIYGACLLVLLKLLILLPSRIAGKVAWHLIRHLGRVIPECHSATIKIFEDSLFRFQLRDPYWARLLISNFVYEHEIQSFLGELRGTEFSFLDCGANLGYWSIYCSEFSYKCKWVLAVEASPTTYTRLLENCELNGRRFETLHRAIHESSGITVSIKQEGDNHAGAAVGAEGVPVLTITIDELVSSRPISSIPLVIKLDVEGLEIVALKGASNTLMGDVVVIYEDHGSDTESSVTEFVINTLGMQVVYYDDRLRPVVIQSAQDASALKRDRKRGYNFFALSTGSSLRSRLIKDGFC